MREFDKNLRIPFTNNSNEMLRHVFGDQGSEEDIQAIQNGIYTRKTNFTFQDTLKFICFDSNCSAVAAVFQSTDKRRYYMNLEDFQELLFEREFQPDTQTITGQFYFVKSQNNIFSIVKAPKPTNQQEYQTHQRIMREIRVDALRVLEQSVGDNAEDIWNEIATDAVNLIMEYRRPIEMNGWGTFDIKRAIGELLTKKICKKG